MTIAQIETNIQELVQSFNPDTFIYDLLLAYGQPKASITRLQKGGLNLSKTEGEIIWKKQLYYRVAVGEDLLLTAETARKDTNILKHKSRFVIVTDHSSLVAVDLKTQDSLDILVPELVKHYDFFLPWAGMEKAQHQNENPADVKAAERMAKLYDEIQKDNPTETKEEVHNLNVFLSRLLFCFFAEDTGIFEKSQFTHAIASHTQVDGSDLNSYLDTLFAVMNTRERGDIPAYLDAFPYVNGGLFRNAHTAPLFSRRSRQMVIESGELDWSAINPDIFGSMIQAVITPEHRGGLGMHYTSVPNIMKVIEPLFLNELKEQLEAASGNKKKLEELLKRIWRIKIFDPACGSGNFLIIAYKELRRLEMQIFKELGSFAFSEISLGNFYGIELDDFAHEVAILSLWLAEHQMNQEFLREFGRTRPALPLTETGHIVRGNACRIEWESVCPKNEGDEIYILGNPPYLGSRKQDDIQKEDLRFIFQKDYKSMDYIAAWFFKGAMFIKSLNAKCAFVSTNSICQGEQVYLTWNRILEQNVEIAFARTSFKWRNNAKANAGVTVVIIGLRNQSVLKKKLIHENYIAIVDNISPYLTSGGNLIIKSRQSPLSNMPEMNFGNMAADGGKFFFSEPEKSKFENDYPISGNFFRKVYGAEEFINGKERWCLWMENVSLQEAEEFSGINKLIDEVREIRLKSSRPKLAQIPHLFAQITQDTMHDFILIPSVSSENREYIPIGHLSNENISTNLCLIISNPPVFLFSVLMSKMHMAWVKSIGGKLETRYRYSKDVVYNNFPFPEINEQQKQELEKHAYRILEEREHYCEKTLAQLYDPDKMPEGLREAHRQNDLAVERCYRSKPFESDEERLEYLFKLYEQMIEEEKKREAGKKKKK